MRTFKEILEDVTMACTYNFNTGYKDIRPDVVNAATKIYVVELYWDNINKLNLEQRKEILSEQTNKLMMEMAFSEL